MQATDSSTETRPRPILRRVLLVVFLLAIIAALVFIPPYISVNRLRLRITNSISQSLGRTAHIDDVTLNLLPWPGFTLKNLVIDDDPSFSHEPIIRANVVSVRLRLSSLWGRRVEFSTISFGIDEHGSGPSLNLVRNAAGQWNLESILVQASRVDVAPTAQRSAGPSPRFPYIQATGARINLKRGSEKLPFSLTDAEFHLSLTNPQQWRLHLEGRPARTDTNASDTGTLRLEGTLNRAASFQNVPIDLTAAWDKVPLGEATRVLTGTDAGWRGDLRLSASITGTLGATLLDAQAQVSALHRNDFSPAHPIDLDLRCTSRTSILTRSLDDLKCLLPLEPSTGRQILLTGNVPDVHRLDTATWQMTVSKVPATWCLDWARMFSQRIPGDLAPTGDLNGTLAHEPTGYRAAFHTDLTQQGPANTPLALTANLQLGPPPPSTQPAPQPRRGAKTKPQPTTDSPWLPNPPADTLVLIPTELHLGTAQLGLDASFTTDRYTFHLTGTAPPAKILLFKQLLPPSTDTLETLLAPTTTDTIQKPASDQQSTSTQPAETPQHGDGSQHIDITCTRDWPTPQQTCTATPTPAKPAPHPHHHH